MKTRLTLFLLAISAALLGGCVESSTYYHRSYAPGTTALIIAVENVTLTEEQYQARRDEIIAYLISRNYITSRSDLINDPAQAQRIIRAIISSEGGFRISVFTQDGSSSNRAVASTSYYGTYYSDPYYYGDRYYYGSDIAPGYYGPVYPPYYYDGRRRDDDRRRHDQNPRDNNDDDHHHSRPNPTPHNDNNHPNPSPSPVPDQPRTRDHTGPNYHRPTGDSSNSPSPRDRFNDAARNNNNNGGNWRRPTNDTPSSPQRPTETYTPPPTPPAREQNNPPPAPPPRESAPPPANDSKNDDNRSPYQRFKDAQRNGD